MADFRRSLTALAVFALLLGVASTASAQPVPAFTCTAANGAVPPLLRAEGLTELTGDILLNCQGGTTVTTGTIPQANVTVFLNTTVTSRLIGSNNSSEALLLVGEPAAANIRICDPANMGGGSACANDAATGGAVSGGAAYNAFQGQWGGSASNAVTFLGVPVNPPGTNGTLVFRITNVRANASGIGVGAGFITNQVQATVGISGSTSIPVNNNLLNVGVVQKGLNSYVRKPSDLGSSVSSSSITLNQCSDNSRKGAEAVLQFDEGFATSFKTRTVPSGTPPAYPTPVPYDTGATSTAPQLQNVPGAIYNSESGFMPATTIGGNGSIGLADFGTRLKAVFNNVPTGVSVYVTIYNINMTQNQFARLVGSETGSFFSVPATNTDVTAITPPTGTTGTTSVAQLPVVNNSAMAVWEVMASDPLAQQSFYFGVYFGWTGAAGATPPSPAAGIGTVNLSFAPTPPSFSATDGAKASSSLPIPRFADTSTATNVLNIVVCKTNLLFPYTPNVAGFDTGIEISNTSLDPFGTSPQGGTCTLNWYGSTANGTGPAPPATSVASIAGGGIYANLVSTLAPGFNGYMIAVCNFQYAHGFAYIYSRDLGQAQGYLALVIQEPARSAVAPGGSGEQLAQ